MSSIGQFVGALIATYFVSRLVFWLMKGWDGGPRKIVVAHAMSLAICGLVGGIGLATDGGFVGLSALFIYGVPQAIWMAVDLLRLRKRDQSGTLAIRRIQRP